MCTIIVINNGQKEIETPRQFAEHFGFEAPKKEWYDEIDIDSCLCQVDIEKAVTDNKVEFEIYAGDYYVNKTINENEK